MTIYSLDLAQSPFILITMELKYPVKINDFFKVVFEGEKVTLKSAVLRGVSRSHKKLTDFIKSGKVGYGINTGFGKLAGTRISEKELLDLQKNIVLSHASGVGKHLDEDVVLGAMFARVTSLASGYSGVKPDTLKLLVGMINRRVIPVVPEKGSVGASGDLAPSAHMALVMIGKGKATYNGRVYPGKTALKKAGLKPIKLSPKEGLALLNGTHFMTSMGCIGLWHAKNLLRLANISAALSIEGIKGRLEPFNRELNRLRGYKGQSKVASEIRRLLKGSSQKRTERVQDPYSFRCVPQVHGAVFDVIQYAEKVFETELNSVTDNPLLINGRVYSGGNFHGEPIAFALDFLGVAITELSSISERRIAQLMDTSFTALPPFLVERPGVNSGFMLPQVTAAALVSQNRILSHPASVDSIPTSANQEDHVSMGLNAGLKLMEIIENTYFVLAIELLAGAQAIDLRKEKISPAMRKIHRRIRENIPFYKKDREHSDAILHLSRMMRKGEI